MVLIALAVVLPGLLIAFSVWTQTEIGVIGGIAVYLLEGGAALLLGIVRWLARGTWQICPRCHRRQPAGYSHCICGYPDR